MALDAAEWAPSTASLAHKPSQDITPPFVRYGLKANGEWKCGSPSLFANFIFANEPLTN
jgi:hypothetical protein